MLSTMEVYTTGGAYYLWDVFNFLAAYTSGGNFAMLISIGLTLGVAAAAWQMAFGGNLRQIIQYVVIVMVVLTISVGPKARVVIIDETSGTIPIYGIVDNVPYSVALLGHYTSSISYYVTGQMETLLSTPTDLTYQKNGILFGSTLLSQAARWRAVSPKIHENLVNFMQGCVVDAVNLGHMDLELVAREGDLEGALGSSLPASLGYYDVVAGQTQACRAGWPTVKAQIQAEVDKVLADKAAGIFQGANANGAANVNRLKGTLADFQGLMAMSSASAVSTIKQSMYVLAMDDGVQRMIASSGNAASMELYQAARAEIQTRASYSAIGVNAAKWVPLLKIVMETLYYAAFPLALFMMMTPLAPQVLKGYAGGFVWIASWEPLSAILHTVVIKAATGYYRQAGVISTDGSVQDVVLSFANHYGIQAVEQDVGSVAGFLMMSVPFLATSIMFGAGKMVGMATSMLNVSQGAAIETGREAATGSIGLGNLNMSNYATNKGNMSTVWDAGRSSVTMPNGAVATLNENGVLTYATGTAVTNSGVSSSLSSAVSSEITSRAESARSAVSSTANEFGDYLTSGAQAFTDFAKSVTSGSSASAGGSRDMSNERRQEVRDAWNQIERFAAENGVSTDTALRAALAAKAGGSLWGEGGVPKFLEQFSPAGAKGRVDVGADSSITGSVGAASSERFSSIVDAAKDRGLTDALSTLDSARTSTSYSDSTGTSSSAGEGQRFSLDQGERLAKTLMRRLDESEQWSNAESYVERGGVAVEQNLNNLLASNLQERGYSPMETSVVLNPQTEAQYRESQFIVSDIANDIVRQFGIGGAPADPTAGFDPAAIPGAPADLAPPQRETSYDGQTRSIDGETAGANALIGDARGKVDQGTEIYGNAQESLAPVRAENVDTRTAEIADQSDRPVSLAMTQRFGHVLGLRDSEVQNLAEAYPSAFTSPGAALDYFDANPDKFEEVIGRPFLSGGEASSPPVNTPANDAPATPPAEERAALPMTPLPISVEERDIVVRTVLGEAANEGVVGQAAVALVIRNRMVDSDFPDTAGEVALQPRQFSAWNNDGSGNDLVRKYSPGDPVYDQAAYAVDIVMSGMVEDFTQGATHYYSPAGMRALVEQGYQNNLIPGWLDNVSAERDAPLVRVGGHIFTGQTDG